MTTKYVAYNYEERAGAYPEVFDTLEEANEWIEVEYIRLDMREKKALSTEYYVAKVTEDDLTEPGDWTSFEDYETGLDFFDSREFGTIKVIYGSGESRETPGKAIDYMLARFNENDENYLREPYDDITELYIEAENPTWDAELEEYEDEFACYEDLKEAMIQVAFNVGVHPSRLSFPYDD